VKASSEPLLPPKTIGIVGGGQLGQMLALSAKSMGYKVGVLDPTPACPAGQVADFQITAEYTDRQALLDLATKSDVLTYEFENVDVNTLQAAQKLTALPQGTDLLTITGNRLNEKNFLNDHQIPVTPFMRVTNGEELGEALAKLNYPCILKTADGGYDGHGQQDISSSTDVPKAKELLQRDTCILEKRQPFAKELSVMVTRSASGDVKTFPVAENVHYHHILHKSIVPARVESAIQEKAQQLAVRIATGLKLRGVLGIEYFMLADGSLLVNELAPRPHNSGHYSIEACNISQFEAHIRSICGLVIPEITQVMPAVMVNLLGQHLQPAKQILIDQPTWHFHDYGKAESRLNRKMGHITILGNIEQSLAEIKAKNIWEAEQ
jgi:5-(carboxyamino)imidazole ribonucleotide synthase